jgi:SanA protein
MKTISVVGAALLLGTGLLIVDAWRIPSLAKGRLFDDVEFVPKKQVGLVLGCVPVLPDGRNNWYFKYRMDAAAALYHAQKVEYLLVSGDNHRQGYDEPTSMRDALVARKVPSSRIIIDYAGFRTLDSVARAKEVFGQNQLVIVSQRFHNERAIYLAKAFGLDVVAYNAKSVDSVASDITWFREPLARLRAVLDVRVLRTRPRFTGPRVVIRESAG